MGTPPVSGSRAKPTRAGSALTRGQLGATPRRNEFQNKIIALPNGSLSVRRPAGGAAGDLEDHPKSIEMSEKQNANATAVVDDVFTSDPDKKGDLLPVDLQQLREEMRAAGDTEGLEELSAMILTRAKADDAAGVPVATPNTAAALLSPASLWLHYSLATDDRKQFFSDVIANCDLSNLSEEDAQTAKDLAAEGKPPAEVLAGIFAKHGYDPNQQFDPNTLGQPGDKGLRDLYDMWAGAFFNCWTETESPVIETVYKLKGKDEWLPLDQLKGREGEIEMVQTGTEQKATGASDESGPTYETVPVYNGGRVSKNQPKKDKDGNVVMQKTGQPDATFLSSIVQGLSDKVSGGNLAGDPQKMRGLTRKAQELNASAGVPPEKNVGKNAPPPAAQPAAAAPAGEQEVGNDAKPKVNMPSSDFEPRKLSEIEAQYGPAPNNIVAYLGYIFGIASNELKEKVKTAADGLMGIIPPEGEDPDQASGKEFDIGMFALQGLEKQYELANSVGGSLMNGMGDSAKSIFRG